MKVRRIDWTVPHNRQLLDLRVFFACYLCGGQWERVRVNRKDGVKKDAYPRELVVMCSKCELTSFAKKDEAVMEARGWE